MALRIPRDEVPVLAKFFSLSKVAEDELVTALSSAKATSLPSEMAAMIANQVPSIPATDLAEIVRLTYSLLWVRETSASSHSRFMTELLDASLSEQIIQTGSVDAARARLDRVLHIPSLEVISKATILQRDGERLYCDAKILTDIRPVFDDEDPEKRPESAVITHTLKLAYHEGRRHKEVFVVLDAADLDDLQEAIERAKAKAATLDSLLTETKIENLGV